MIKLNYERGPFGDETSNYSVETDAINVAQFIEQVLKEKTGEWGEILISSNDCSENMCVCSYKKGTIERRASNYDTYGTAKIKSILANGGWTKMRYEINVEDFDSLPKQDREEFQIVYWGSVLIK